MPNSQDPCLEHRSLLSNRSRSCAGSNRPSSLPLTFWTCSQTSRGHNCPPSLAVPHGSVTQSPSRPKLEAMSRPPSEQVSWPAPQGQQYTSCWHLEVSCHAWTLRGDAIVLDDYALTTTMTTLPPQGCEAGAYRIVVSMLNTRLSLPTLCWMCSNLCDWCIICRSNLLDSFSMNMHFFTVVGVQDTAYVIEKWSISCRVLTTIRIMIIITINIFITEVVFASRKWTHPNHIAFLQYLLPAALCLRALKIIMIMITYC